MLPFSYFLEKKIISAHPEFLSPELCQNICQEMAKGQSTKAVINISSGELVADDIRKTSMVQISDEYYQILKEKLEKLIPELNEFHHLQLEFCQEIQFLKYQTGDFFVPHTDHYRHLEPGIRQRQLSAVMFLNSPHEGQAQYRGGELVLYAPSIHLQQRLIGLPLQAESGLLITFLPEILHEVKKVAQGERYTIVAWYV